MKILAMSDLHQNLPPLGPDVDLVLVAGDLDLVFTSPKERERFWHELLPGYCGRYPATRFVATAGNHDDYVEGMARGEPRTPTMPNLEFLVDSKAEVLGLTIWGAPWNDVVGMAFGRDPLTMATQFSLIPEGLDILLVHQPPAGCGAGVVWARTRDERGRVLDIEAQDLGSESLRDRILQVRPRLVVCGHYHSAHGVYDLDGIPVINGALVDDEYVQVHDPREVVLPKRTPR